MRSRASARAACALLVVPLLVLPLVPALGCNGCRHQSTQVAIPLEAEDMGKSCEDVCGEVINLLSDFTGCSEGATDDGDPAAICRYEIEICPSNSF